MKDDFGYFGSGLEGYVQYNESFKRNINVQAPAYSFDSDVSDIALDDDELFEDDSDDDFVDDDPSDTDDS